MEKIDNLDLKILYNLDKDSRQSASHLAKKLRVHRNVINFRINKLVEKGIIRHFITMINPLVLDLHPYKIYLQLQNLTLQQETKLLQLINKLPVYWAAKVSGHWDFIIGLLVKNIDELNHIQKQILQLLGEDIINKSILAIVDAPHYYRTYLTPDKEISPVKLWTKTKIEHKITPLDIKILKIMAQNARIPVTEIAANTNITIKTAITRIKKLKKDNIIFDFRLSLNLNKIGYQFFKCFITLKHANEKREKEFLLYCQTNKNIIHVIETIGEWDLEPEIETESNEQFYHIISEIREKFSDIIREIKTIDIIKEYSYVCIPISTN